MENQSIGILYYNAIDAASPTLILLVLGCLLIVFKMFDDYNIFSGIAFSIGIAISSINVLVSHSITQDDWIYIFIMFLVFLISLVPTIFVSLLWEKGKRMKMYCAILTVISLNNSVITGIPILSGIYKKALVTKAAYLQMIPCVLLDLTVILILFEFSVMLNSNEDDEQTHNVTETEVKHNSDAIKQVKDELELTKEQQENLIAIRKTEKRYILKQNVKNMVIMISMSIIKSFKSPLIISVIIGIILHYIFNSYNIKFPRFIGLLFEYESFVAGPLGLLLIGMYIYLQAVALYKKISEVKKKKKGESMHDYANEQELPNQSKTKVDVDTVLSFVSDSIDSEKLYVREKRKEIVVRIIIVLYTAIFKHLLTPILFVMLSKELAPADYEYSDVEINAVMLGEPPAVFSFVICTNYAIGEWIAGFEVVFGIIFGILIIPIIELFSRYWYNV